MITKFRTLSAITLFLSAATILTAGEPKKEDVTITDPAKAGADFVVQGEYSGEIPDGDGGMEKLGIQVIALGDGKFDAVGYPGGLPGDGWNGEEKHKGTGETTDGVTTLKGDKGVAEIEDGVLTIKQDGQAVCTLKKVERKSPTLGKKPPKGAVVLFDGKSADAFKDGKTTEDGHLLAGVESKEKFGDHSFHLEFRTPFKPFAREQARGNSGVYLHGRYECQVLDSFGLEGEDNECGGIYSIAKPAVNACFPPLSWQTYDVDFTAARYDADGKKIKNARATIRQNGILIHDDLELTKGTPGKNAEGPGPGPIYLQGHGNPVVYRNIWVVKK